MKPSLKNRLVELRANLTRDEEKMSTGKKVAIGAGALAAGGLAYGSYRAHKGIQRGVKDIAGRVLGTMGRSMVASAPAAPKIPYKSRLVRPGVRLKKLSATLDTAIELARGDHAGKWLDKNADAARSPKSVAALKAAAKQRGLGAANLERRKGLAALIKIERSLNQM